MVDTSESALAYRLDASSSDEVKLWLQQVHAALEKQPARELFAKFSRDVTVQVVNQASTFVQRVFNWRIDGAEDAAVEEQQFHKAKCSIYLYYRVLQGVLDEVDGSESLQWMATQVSFQEGLLNCAVELVTFAWHAAEAPFPAATMQLGRLHRSLDLWEATSHFRQQLGPGGALPMPEAAARYLGFMRARIAEELAFLPGSSLYPCICAGGGGSRREGDYTLVRDFVGISAKMAGHRCAEVGRHLAAAMPSLQGHSDFAARVQAAMGHLQSGHYELLFEQHQLNLVACCCYAITRVLNVSVPFKRVTEAVSQAFPLAPLSLFEEAVITPSTASEDGLGTFGDTRALYNQKFLPAMQEYLNAESRAVAAAASAHSSSGGKGLRAGLGVGEENSGSVVGKRSGQSGLLRLPLQSLTATDMTTRSPRVTLGTGRRK